MDSFSSHSPSLLNGKSILVVEDEGDIRDHLIQTMERLGGNVSAVANGKAAIEVLRAGHFDFVISDLLMGGGGGIALIRDIQKYLIKKPKIFIYSAYISPPDKLAIEASGLVVGTFEKPFRSEHLAAAMAKHLPEQETAHSIVDHSDQLI